MRMLALALATLALSSLAFAEEDEASHVHAMHVAAFTGATTNLDPTHTAFTVGADVERRFGTLGVGLLTDVELGDHTTVIVAPMLVVHFGRAVKLHLAPGLVTGNDNTSWIVRGGLAYDLHAGPFVLGPMVAVEGNDDGTMVVYGASLGMGW